MFKLKYPIKFQLIENKLNRPMIKASARTFGVAHDTGNINSTARQNVAYFNRKFQVIKGRNYEMGLDQHGLFVPFRVASAHSFTDDKEIIICIPLDEKAWHVLYNVPTDNTMFGGNSNDIAIGHELNYFDDAARTRKAYDKYVWLWAYTAHLYGWKDIRKSITFHSVLDPGRKSDPMNAFKIIGKTYEDFLQDIAQEYEDCLNERIEDDMSKYFKDISAEHYVGRYADSLYEKQILSGKKAANGDIILDGNANITRNEAVVLIGKSVDFMLKEIKK